jgi:YNFM family putative membrane transporter
MGKTNPSVGARSDLSCLSLSVGGKAAAVTWTSPLSGLAAPAGEPALIVGGGARFWRVSLAMFFSGFVTFAVLYCVQTAGFFGGHSIASSWVGLRAETAKAQASALCLFFYYAGSSLADSICGWVFAGDGWPGVAAFVGALAVLALVVTMQLARVPPPARLRAS